MSFRARPDISSIDIFNRPTNQFVECDFCGKEFTGEQKNWVTIAREHVRKHVSRGELFLDDVAGEDFVLDDVFVEGKIML